MPDYVFSDEFEPGELAYADQLYKKYSDRITWATAIVMAAKVLYKEGQPDITKSFTHQITGTIKHTPFNELCAMLLLAIEMLANNMLNEMTDEESSEMTKSLLDNLSELRESFQEE